MKKIFAFFLFAVAFAAVIPGMADDSKVMFKNGKSVPMSSVISKDQFGIMIHCGKDTETGETLRRFVPFADMNPASLALFPFCDVKAVERIYAAVRDRAELLKTKFARRYQEFENAQDYTKLLKIHSGVPSYDVLFSARESLANGLIGFLYSDTASALFYGKIYLHGLKGEKDTVWVGTIYPTEKTFTHKGAVYPVFTVIPPKQDVPEYDGGRLMHPDEKKDEKKAADADKEKRHRRGPRSKDGARPQRPRPQGENVRPQGQRPQGGGMRGNGHVPSRGR